MRDLYAPYTEIVSVLHCMQFPFISQTRGWYSSKSTFVLLMVMDDAATLHVTWKLVKGSRDDFGDQI